MQKSSRDPRVRLTMTGSGLAAPKQAREAHVSTTNKHGETTHSSVIPRTANKDPSPSPSRSQTVKIV